MTPEELAEAVRARTDLTVIDQAGGVLTVARPGDAPFQYQAVAVADDGWPYWTWHRKTAGPAHRDASMVWVTGLRIDGDTADEAAASIADLMCLPDRYGRNTVG